MTLREEKAMLTLTRFSKEATSQLRKCMHEKAGRPPREEKYPGIH